MINTLKFKSWEIINCTDTWLHEYLFEIKSRGFLLTKVFDMQARRHVSSAVSHVHDDDTPSPLLKFGGKFWSRKKMCRSPPPHPRDFFRAGAQGFMAGATVASFALLTQTPWRRPCLYVTLTIGFPSQFRKLLPQIHNNVYSNSSVCLGEVLWSNKFVFRALIFVYRHPNWLSQTSNTQMCIQFHLWAYISTHVHSI